MTDKPTPCPACPPWCTVDHDTPITGPDGKVITLPDGRPLMQDGHRSAREWTPGGTLVTLGQMPRGPVTVALTALSAGAVLLKVDQARTLAGVLKSDGAVELADAIRATLARLDGEAAR